jgi:hypothetical protein
MKINQAQIIIEYKGKPGVVKLSAGQLEALGLYLPSICGGNVVIQQEKTLAPLK